MHVQAITPIHVTDAELARRQERYDTLAPPGISVHLENLASGSDIPRQLATEDDITASDHAVRAWFAELDPTTVDIALPDCVLDPGLEGPEPLPVRSVGITQLAAGVVASLGERFTAVARNRAIADELDRILRRYGHLNVEPTRVLDLSFEAIADHEVWNDTVRTLTSELASTPIRRVLNGCSAVDVRPDRSGVTVFDPTRLALDVLALAHKHDLLVEQEVAADV